MTRAVLVCLALVSCAPTYRLTAKRVNPAASNCPTTTMVLGDFVASGVALALSVLAYNAGDYARATVAGGLGMGLALADNIAEATCSR